MELFELFVTNANPDDGLHALDQGRLADYVTASHRAELPVDDAELREQMERANFEDALARSVVERVHFGREVLERYDAGLNK